MENKINKKSVLSLIIIGILSGIIWHIEIICYGWAGLIWTTYFHLAIPISVFMLLIWLFIVKQNANIQRRILFIISAFLVSMIVYVLSSIFMEITFSAGPNAILSLFFSIDKACFILVYLSYFLPVIIAALTYFVTRIFFQGTKVRYFFISCAMVYLSIPLSLLFLGFIGNKIYGFTIQTDFLHSVKTGIIIPFMIFSIGFPYIFNDTKTTVPDES